MSGLEPRLRASARRGKLTLSYDDGPGALMTPRLLQYLQALEARVTFFLLGRRVVQSPEIVDRIATAGHEIGCHTHDHLHAWKTSPWRVRADIDRGYETLSPWISSDAVFRPPYGKLTPWSIRALKRRGAPIVKWTLDSGDTWARLPRPADVVEKAKRDRGGVVLLHDFDREGPDREERADFVLDTTERLLIAAREEGWRVVTISELLGYSQESSG